MLDIPAVQKALADFQFDGWLLYDFRGSNVLAQRILKIDPARHATRRFAYFVPRVGAPRKLVHRIEPGTLDHLPGEPTTYLRWEEFEAGIASLVAGAGRVAMEYSARNAIPYVSRVDAGTVELVRAAGAEVVCSGDLVQLFEATWDDEQWAMHREAEKHTVAAYDVVWKFIAESVRGGRSIREVDVQRLIMDHFARNGMVTDHAPIVGVGPHSGDPHYSPETGKDSEIRAGDFVLVDLWAKLNRSRGVYSDLTRTGFVGDTVPEQYERVFQIVRQARDAAIHCVEAAYCDGRRLYGWEVDQAARNVIEQSGYGAAFVHRTGHSIGQETHGNGANMDNLETHEERLVLPRTCFSVEPGIYLPEFGVRSEVNVFVDGTGKVHVTGGPVQERVVAILKEY
jgi:Xaa-Pro dipeptidase